MCIAIKEIGSTLPVGEQILGAGGALIRKNKPKTMI
jgi:hypothetical protein